MKKIFTLMVVAVLAANVSIFGNSGGFYDDYITLKLNGEDNWYGIGDYSTGHPAFNNCDLGTVHELSITGCDMKYWRESGAQNGGAFYYAVKNADNTDVIVNATEVIWDHVSLGGNDFQGTIAVSINLLQNLFPNTTYKLHIWAKQWGAEDYWLSNGGGNYVATFTTPNYYISSSYIFNGTDPDDDAVWYNGSGTGNATFEDLGINPNLKLGAEFQLHNYPNSDAVSAKLYYMIVNNENEGIVPPTSITIPYKSDNQWRSTEGGEIDLSSLENGSYILHCWFAATVNDNITAYDSNLENNYTATFVVDNTLSVSNAFADQQVKSEDFYTVSGQKVTENYKGVVIKKITYTNGQVKVEKVLALK